MNRFFHLQEIPDPKIQSAFRFISIVMVATLAALLLEVYLAIRTGAWQLWVLASTVLLVLVAASIGRRLILAGKTERAVQYVILSVMLAIVATPFMIADISTSLALAGVILTIELASRATGRAERYVIFSLVVAVSAVLLDLLLPTGRLAVPALQIFTPLATGVVLIILGILTVRGFRDYSLRTKMIIIILTIVMISVTTLAFVANRSLTTNLRESIGNNLYSNANSAATSIVEVIDREYSFLKVLSFDQNVRISMEIANLGKALSQSEIEQLDSQWRAADENNLLVASVLQSTAAPQLRQLQKEFPQNVEVLLTNQQGVIIAATDRTSDYYQADEEWWQVAYKEGLYIGQPEYDESNKVTAMVIAVAVQEQGTRNIGGVLRTTVTLDSLAQTLGDGVSGQTVVYLQNGQELALVPGSEGTSSIVLEESGLDTEAFNRAGKDKFFEIDYDGVPMLASRFEVSDLPEGAAASAANTATMQRARAISNMHMNVVVFQEQTEAQKPIASQSRNLIILAFAILGVATFAALGLAQVIAGPIVRLNAVAEKVAEGDLSIQAAVETEDEIGMLAKTFNSMTAQLHDLVSTLERRVADRTKALATSAEVSRNLSTIMNERQLIIEVVEQLKAAFDYYHVHIYLLDEASGDLIMAGGTGEVGAAMLGSGHRITKGKGLVGRAAQTNVPVLVVDTAKDPAWLPNPLLPETKSEAALPISTGDTVLGILDVQDDEINGLTIEDFRLLQSLTSQIAIALLNARSYASVHERAEREARITSIGLKIKSTTSIEGALQITARELGRALNTEDIRVILEAPGSTKNPEELN